MNEPKLSVEVVQDPEEMATALGQFERGRRNIEWLSSHWHEILPGARGRFVAVAGQEAFVADSSSEALEQARRAHPADDGVTIQYVVAAEGPRIYANLRHVASVR